MSAIGSIDSTSQSLLLQQIRQQMQAGSLQMPPPSTEMRPQLGEAESESVAEALGLDVSELAEIQTEIQEAIQSALEESAEGEDPRSTIEGAVNSVLEDHGVDPEEFKAEMESHLKQMGGPSRPPGMQMGAMGASDGSDSTSESAGSNFLSMLLGADESEEGSSIFSSDFFSSLPAGFLIDQYV